METNAVSSISNDPTGAEPPSLELTTPGATTPLNPSHKSSRHQLPSPGSDADDKDSLSMLDILPETPSPNRITLVWQS